MQISEFLSADDCLVDVRAADKDALLRELARRAAAAAGIDVTMVAGEIEKREQLGSTGMGGGIAIPHARIAGLTKPVGVLARLRRAIDFAAIDGKPVDIVFLLLLPAAAQGESLTALAAVARRLRDEATTARLRAAVDRGDAYRVMTAA
jgi:PTS system nitrogen regulatory IIA component